MRLEKRWTTETRTVAVVLEWFNVLFQEEAFDWRCDDRTRQCTPEYIGPVTIPSIGVEGAF
ncbi:MAG: hypothetical protein HYV09_01355 [Deltaproteobacteria bacterium]|nr:hypothetical protein [Deltaproteobacteria bacterium]